MKNDAYDEYQEMLCLIDMEEQCDIRAARLSASLKREKAEKDYIHAQMKNLKSSTRTTVRRKVSDVSDAVTPTVQQNNINVMFSNTTAPNFNQNGDGGQYVADNIYTQPV